MSALGSSNSELQNLTSSLRDSKGIWNEVSTVRSKVMTNSTSDISADISINGQMLEDVTSFKHLRAALCKGGTCSAQNRIRFASAMAAMAGLNRIW